MSDRHFGFVSYCDECGHITEKKHLHSGLCRQCYENQGGFMPSKKRANWYE